LVCEECAFVLRQGPRVVAGSLFMRGGGLVLVRRASEPARGAWAYPGGDVERGETVVAAVVRQTQADTGLRVRPIGVLDVYSSEEENVIAIPYASDLVDGEPRPGAGCLEVSAFAPERLPWDELAFISTRAVLQDYLRRFFPRVRLPR
jgi:ADP-ribose pyrophosphatase YjhB (NUDIX family)